MANQNYTCREYRQEMQLLALRRRLADRELSEREKKELQAEILRLEAQMQMD